MSTAADLTAALDGAQTPDDLTRPLYGATFGQAITRFFKRYASFSGRSSRSEFWWVQLAFVIVNTLLGLIAAPFAKQVPTGSEILPYMTQYPGWYTFIAGVIGVATIVPSLALTWRRLHDSNLAGPYFFLALIPVVGWIVLIVFYVRASRPEGRRFDRR